MNLFGFCAEFCSLVEKLKSKKGQFKNYLKRRHEER